ncbi:MAG: glutamine synthetase family protein [Paracoccaceae bacterium]
MPGNLTFADLKKRVKDGTIDTVIACAPDMQGRLMGKRFHAQYFIDGGHEETHCCNYLLATDLEMTTVQGYASTSWAAGYGDYVMKPDLSTMRLIPWLEKTALVLSDLLDHHSHQPVPHSPRAVLKGQIERLKKLGLTAFAATELEFFVFRETYDAARDMGYRGLTTISPYNEDYHIFQTTKEEGLMRAIRNGLYGAGVTVENTKGEADAGQAEVNIKYSDALDTGDTHVLVKNAVKEIAWAQGHAITFMAKPHHKMAGSSSHIHLSIWKDGKNAFHDPKGKHGMSALMENYLAGLLAHADGMTYFLAPYINSYKRFAAGTFAPTKAIWSADNRTAGYRICGSGTKAVRVECRVGGSDLNPYLALAAQIAAGIAGIEGKMKLEPEFSGDAYAAQKARDIPRTLRAATAALDGSKMLRKAFGDAVIDHYVHAANWEQEDFDRKVTDYEIARGFERS